MSTRREEAVALLDAARDAVALGAADIEACIERAFHAAHEDPRLRADVQALRIRHWNWAGNVANAAVLAGTEARLVEAHDPQRAARLAVEGLLGWIHVGDMMRASEAAEEILKDLVPDDDDALYVAARIGLAWALAARGDPEGEEILDGLEHRAGSLALIPLGVTSYVGYLRAMLGDLVAGRSLLLGVQVAARRSDPDVLPFVHSFLADLEYRAGAWGAGEALVTDAVAHARRLGSVNALGIALMVLARFEAATGRRDQALAHLAEANTISQRGGTHTLSHTIAMVHGTMALLDGDADAAVGHLRGSHEHVLGLGIRHPGFAQDYADLVEALFRSGLVAEAAHCLAALERLVESTRCPPALAGLTRARLVMCPDDDVERLAEDARRDFRELPLPFERARTLYLLGVRRRRGRDRSRARADLGEAVAELERLGAVPWANLARTELRAAGGQLGPARAGLATIRGAGLTALSAQESQVARAVGRGASNREVAAALFLSVKTVERHLTAIYQKLGLRSRAELLVWLASHGALGARGESASVADAPSS